jgi:hypothetical protein
MAKKTDEFARSVASASGRVAAENSDPVVIPAPANLVVRLKLGSQLLLRRAFAHVHRSMTGTMLRAPFVLAIVLVGSRGTLPRSTIIDDAGQLWQMCGRREYEHGRCGKRTALVCRSL